MARGVSPIGEEEARALLAPLAAHPTVLLAVSGGGDSLALLRLAVMAALPGVELRVATVDHRLQPGSAEVAAGVVRWAQQAGLPAAVLCWSGERAARGVEAAARAARYRLLIDHARAVGATAIVTAHTEDDQAETVLMRLAAGSGPAGLAAMAPALMREGVAIVRPLLGVSRARLRQTCRAAGITPWEDPMNRDTRFARPRLRRLRRFADRLGLTAPRLARLASRMARVEAALAARVAALDPDPAGPPLPYAALLAEPQEIRLRVLLARLRAAGAPEPLRLERVERLLEALDGAAAAGAPLGRTLAGRLVRLDAAGRLRLMPAPPRRR